MKFLFYSQTLVALAVAAVAAAGAVIPAQAQAPEPPVPPPSADSALPADIVPGSPLADVLKMLQAGVDVTTIKSYILNAQSAFNLDADKILYLKDAGAPNDIINAMLDRDKALYAATVAPPPVPAPPTPPPPTPAPAVDLTAPNPPDLAPPPADVTMGYFDDTLAPYGSWVEVAGYGQCWRPTAEIYDAGWSPYCDYGHWVYTDYGWYWDSDYAWGLTFHYGRWFRSPGLGWCWYPDTVWAPSWVVWRSSGDYCGWAPLPPFAVFRPGAGFFYRGVSVGLDFDFGLAANCFIFVSPDHFCDRRPRSFALPPQRVAQIFRQTTVVNNYSVNNKTIVNRGFGVERITSVTHRPIETARMSTLPNAGRQGWRGEGFERTLRPPEANNNYDQRGNNLPGRNFSPGGAPVGNGEFRRDPGVNHNPGGAVANPYRGYPVQTTPGARNQWQPNLPYQWQQGRAGSTVGNDGVSQRGAAPPPRQFVQPEQPRPEARPNAGETQPRQFSQPPAPPVPPAQPQPEHNPGGAPNGGANNGNNNNNNGSNKQNH